MRVGVFEARFSRFINLSATGANVDVVADDGSVNAVPSVFRSVRARLRGVEAQAKHRQIEAGAWSFDSSGQLDLACRRPQPRRAAACIAPARVRLGLDAVTGPCQPVPSLYSLLFIKPGFYPVSS